MAPKTPEISRMGKMVLRSVKFPHKYPTPSTSPSPKPHKARRKISAAASSSTVMGDEAMGPGYSPQQPKQEANRKSGHKVHRQHSPSFAPAGPVSPPAEKQTFNANGHVMVSVPQLDSEERAKSKAVSNMDQSRKRKREIDDEDYQDQRVKASAVVEALVQTINKAIYASESYSADSYDSEYLEYFHQSSLLSDSEVPVLSEAALLKLESAIQTTTQSFVFNRVPIEKLIRLQKLLEGTIGCVTKFTFSIDGGASESEIDEWSQSLEIATTALLGMDVLLRTMTAKREEKELYSEDILGNTISNLEHIIGSSIIPVVEARASSSNFKLYSAKKRELADVLRLSRRVFVLLGKLFANVDTSESAVNKVGELAKQLIFVENASFEKESVLGVKSFESMRRAAMDATASIFTRYPSLRTGIIDDILVSLDKLPSTRQSARQFQLKDGKPIQLVSALLMRLVQTSAMWTGIDTAKARKRRPKSEDEDDEPSEEDEDEAPQDQPRRLLQKPPIDIDDFNKYTVHDAANELKSVSKALFDNAANNASHVIGFLLQRALNSTKSGDQPYRNLLDIFTEDFLNVIGLPEWPASELLLRNMLSRLLRILDDEKRPVPQKNLALDLITMMGMHISDVKSHIRNASRSLEASQDPIAEVLRQLLQQDDVTYLDLIKQKGPYRVIFEYLSNRPDAQSDSAGALVLVQWADLCLTAAKSDEESVKRRVLLQLRNTIPDRAWLINNYEPFPSLDSQIAKHASTIITSASQFCKLQPVIVKALLASMNSPHPQLKSKGLKMVPQLLDKDPSILERNNVVVQYIIRCCDDVSPLVRQSALSLLEKCTELKPSLEKKAYVRLILLSRDDNIGVRKKSMKLLRDIYMRNDNQEMRSAISVALVVRANDHESSVADLARQYFEELWLAPFYKSATSSHSVQLKVDIQNQISLLVKTMRGDGVHDVLERLLQSILRPDAKNSEANMDVCHRMVSILFDAVIENNTSPDGPTQGELAKTLTIFAKVRPRLFNSQQLELLAPYVNNLQASDSLLMYQQSVIIFRHVMPSLSKIQHEFLRTVRSSLMKAVPKLPRTELPETAACLWNITRALKDSGPLPKFIISLLKQLQALKNVDPAKLAQDTKPIKYMDLAGPFGKLCDFDKDINIFIESGFTWNNNSVSSLIIDHLYPFTHSKFPIPMRESALRSIGMICQAWPRHYLRNDVGMAFDLVFRNDSLNLQAVVLEGFIEFFRQEEKRSETGAEIKVGEGAIYGQERLAKSFIANDNDGAVTTIAQKFLSHILRIALASTDRMALEATKIISSINRQGLVHPKESGPALVALETSTDPDIARIAYEAHQTIHSKHESMFEKEYMKAVNEAFVYQRDIINDPRGITLQPYTAKLRPLFEVLKLGSSKVRKRFLGNICARIKFELPKLDVTGERPNTVLFTRFVIENLAFFDYARIDELLHLIKTLEDMVVTGVGASVAHAIETDVLKVRLPPTMEYNGMMNGDLGMQHFSTVPIHSDFSNTGTVDPSRLRQLTVASMILSMVWECRTHLRTMWGLQKSKVKITAKDFNKAPTRQPFSSSERFVEKVAITAQALDTPESQLALVTSFAELIAVDPELKVNPDDEEDGGFGDLAAKAGGYETPSDGERADGESVPGSGAKARKRKGGNLMVQAGQTPKRQRKSLTPKRKTPRKGRAGSSASADDDDGGWD
jgi:cohesin loading factor subunit SCC2